MYEDDDDELAVPDEPGAWGAGPGGGREDPDDGDGIPEVHPDQTSIPEPLYQPGELGPCYWCSEPAIYDRLDIGLPKRAHQPKTLVKACEFHMRNTVAPEMARRQIEKEKKAHDRRYGH